MTADSRRGLDEAAQEMTKERAQTPKIELQVRRHDVAQEERVQIDIDDPQYDSGGVEEEEEE
jgi:hypothetical protein